MNSLATSYKSHQHLHISEQAFAEVILGKPSADCKHLGICKVTRIYTNDFYSTMLQSFCSNSSKVFALATLIKGQYFELAFQRAFIDAQQYDLHFQKGLFVMEEDYSLENSFMSIPVRLKKGKYKVKMSDRLLTIRFYDL